MKKIILLAMSMFVFSCQSQKSTEIERLSFYAVDMEFECPDSFDISTNSVIHKYKIIDKQYVNILGQWTYELEWITNPTEESIWIQEEQLTEAIIECKKMMETFHAQN